MPSAPSPKMTGQVHVKKKKKTAENYWKRGCFMKGRI
jgi:hypothetical protein